jgi:hypothetical protein
MEAPEIILIPAWEENTPEDRERLKREIEPIVNLAAKPNLYRARSIAKSVLGGWLFQGVGVGIGAGAVAVPWMQVLATVGPALGTALGAWLQAKAGRKIIVKQGPNGEREVQVQDVKELKATLELLKQNQPSKVTLEL